MRRIRMIPLTIAFALILLILAVLALIVPVQVAQIILKGEDAR